jgi:hypothetical protein
MGQLGRRGNVSSTVLFVIVGAWLWASEWADGMLEMTGERSVFVRPFPNDMVR